MWPVWSAPSPTGCWITQAARSLTPPAGFTSANCRLVLERPGLQRHLADAAFQVVLQQLPLQFGGRGLDSPGRFQRLALFALKRDQRFYGAIDLLAQRRDFRDVSQQFVVR